MDEGATGTIKTHFEALEDPRVERAKQRRVLDISTSARCAVIRGAAAWVEVEECGHATQTWRAPFLGIPNGIPSHDTCGRVCADARGAPDAGPIHATYRAVDGGHGRSEIRPAWVITDAATRRSRDPDERWPDLHGSGLAQAERRVGVEISHETRSDISSLAAAARTLHAAVRSHGGSENKVHGVGCLTSPSVRTRAARAGHSAHHMAVLRPIALTLLRHEKTARCGIKARRLRAGWDLPYLLKVLAGSYAIALAKGSLRNTFPFSPQSPSFERRGRIE